ncbi:thioredoxin family protein [Nocardia sp. NPDC059239]|uniref:thioredoxin family protein n=1 Tax=unclassified Nocardia TaxID=2637762 RepID=UPI00369118D1
MLSNDVGSELKVVTDETFEREVLEHPRPVLVEFGAEWCPPCRMVAPVLAAIARERADMLTIYKVDTDENPSVTATYRVMSAPTLILFRGGRPILTVVGALQGQASVRARPCARLCPSES